MVFPDLMGEIEFWPGKVRSKNACWIVRGKAIFSAQRMVAMDTNRLKLNSNSKTSTYKNCNLTIIMAFIL